MIFLNFKTYPETSDQNAVKLCRLIKAINSPVPVIPCLQTSDIHQVVQAVSLPVWAQHLDPVILGKHTGFIAPEAVKQDGAQGSLLNHSEHPLDLNTISQTLQLCQQHQLKTMVITDTIDLINQIVPLRPDYIGFEDPQLIGGPTPMVKARADLVKQAVSASTLPVIIGGGMRSQADIQQAVNLGAAGVLIASEFAKAKDPQSTLRDLINGFQS